MILVQSATILHLQGHLLAPYVHQLMLIVLNALQLLNVLSAPLAGQVILVHLVQ